MEQKSPPGDRIAKVLARAGVASRRDAERLVEAGRVTVNGKKIDSPALNVTERDKITVDGKPLAAAEPPRLWLYHKPTGLVTTAKDEQGRATIFDELPEDMPRVMSVGRLDLNSEGLLLLTNDGELKRRLELPSTGWLRKYRVRVNGKPQDADLEPLRKGVVIEGEKFQPMTVTVDRQQGANAWLTVGLREGKNREIRRAMTEIGLTVNRLIRVSYGPFQLGQLKPGAVEELRRRVLRDQLGLELGDDIGTARAAKGKPGLRPRKPAKPKPEAPAWEGTIFTGKGITAGRAARADGPAGKGPRSGGASTGKGPRTEGGAPGRGPRTGGKPGGFGRDRAQEGEGFNAKPGARARDGSKPGSKTGTKSGPKSGPTSGPKSGAKPGPRTGSGAGPKSGPRPGRDGAPSGPRRKPRG
ncbi:pseudouridine synthase [Pseudooceanicola nanhaiensis]|uniref:pseudouridine synthase n=1 Tax=Pseudooceanicola nanhaiensis TaxID=375761 RepID=UPI001CD3D5E5|nr:pseudouridine synthase [Pseudooceanicola nanhaiensis]MCA0920558.1 pseudouridine synthase [Pseudooceanicola nanhaiensis]